MKRLAWTFILSWLFAHAAWAAPDKIRIGWVYALANAPVVVADKKDFFKSEGLDTKITSFTSGPLVHEALAAGQLDIAYIGSPPVYHGFSRGSQIQILAKVNYGQAAIIVREASTINTLGDLKGKKIAGVSNGSGMDVLLRGYILGEQANLDAENDLRIITMPPINMGPSLESGIVDAAFIWEPFTAQYVLRGGSRIIFDVNQKLPKYPWYVVAATGDTLKTNEANVRKVLRAHKRAVEYLNANPTSGNDLLAEAFKLEDVKTNNDETFSGEQIIAEARKNLGWEWNITPSDEAFIQRLMNYSLELGLINRAPSLSEIIDTRLMEEIASTDSSR